MFLEKQDRKIIPRWRDFTTTAVMGELDSLPLRPRRNVSSDSLNGKLRDWEIFRTPWHAFDLLSSAFVLGRSELILDAAGFIVSNEERCPKPAVDLARRILEPPAALDLVRNVSKEATLADRQIHLIRNRLREEPRNSVLWVEQARQYTMLGQKEQAARAIHMALLLSPCNRFILRSAARFYTHVGDPKEAHRLLLAADCTRWDPWLLAAEVGVASVAKRGSRFAKLAKSMAHSASLSPFAITELASALGTAELEAGKAKIAKKLFRRSLLEPTENSVAQAEWASGHIGGLEIDVEQYNVPRPFEARAWETFKKSEWETSLVSAHNWLNDQPFSTMPAIFASYLSSTLLERYDDSISIVRSSMKANPKEPRLINNLAFALASSGKVAEAQAILDTVDVNAPPVISKVPLMATKGLVLFRKGFPDSGRACYNEAIELARRHSIAKYVALASIYLAREEVLARTPLGVEAVQRAVIECGNQKDPDLVVVLSRVAEMLKASQRPTSARERAPSNG